MTPAAETGLISVLCVDDNDLVADAIAMKLRMTGGFSWAGRLASADELPEAGAASKPSIVLLDVDMPGRDPFVAVRELLERCPQCRVVVFSGHVRRELLDRAIAAGAWGYISKSDGEGALLEGIRAVAGGEFALSPEVRATCERD